MSGDVVPIERGKRRARNPQEWLTGSHSPEAEAALLGRVMLGAARGLDVLGESGIEGRHFYDPRHREVWEAMQRLREKRRAIDPVTVCDELGEKQAGVGGLPFMSDLMASASSADNAAHYAGIIREHATRRQIALEVGDALSRAFLEDVEAPEVLTALHQALGRVELARPDEAKTMAQVMTSTVRHIEQRAAFARGETRGYGGVPTGIMALDRIMGGGLNMGVLTVLGGRPSHGKSAMARCIAAHVSGISDGTGWLYDVQVFSIEDTHQTYGMRQLSASSGVALKRLRAASDVTRDEMADVNEAANVLARRDNWTLDDTAGLTAEEVALRIRRRRSKAKGRQRLVVVDYLTKLRDPRARDIRDRVTRAVQTLDQVAREEGVALLLLAQLSREVEKRDDKRPMLADLREAGEIEEAAESVVFVVRPELTRPDDPGRWRGRAMLLLAKHKNSEACTEAEVAFDGDTASFMDIPPGHEWRPGMERE